jgi:hypothetical protein
MGLLWSLPYLPYPLPMACTHCVSPLGRVLRYKRARYLYCTLPPGRLPITSPTEPNKPVDTIRIGAISVTIWKQPEGYYTATPEHHYKDTEGRWTNRAMTDSVG